MFVDLQCALKNEIMKLVTNYYTFWLTVNRITVTVIVYVVLSWHHS